MAAGLGGRRRRTATRILIGAAVAIAGVVLVASPASAHNYLVSSTPAAGETVTTQPGTFSVTTNDNLLDAYGGQGFAIQISGPGDAPLYYGDGCASVLGPTVSTEAQLGAAGDYTVVWQVVSTDGHNTSGEYTFTWAPDAQQTLAEGSATAPDCNGTVNTGAGSGSGSGGDSTDASESGASAEAGIALGDILWIGGALVAVLVAGVVTVLILRRKQA